MLSDKWDQLNSAKKQVLNLERMFQTYNSDEKENFDMPERDNDAHYKRAIAMRQNTKSVQNLVDEKNFGVFGQ